MSVKMLHTCIRVMDLEKSLKFYKEALGLVETRRKDFPKHKFTLVYLSDAPGGYEIELTYNYNPEVPYELGNGFSFTNYNAEELLMIVEYALSFYKKKEEWSRIVRQALNSNNSWDKSANEYQQLYVETTRT